MSESTAEAAATEAASTAEQETTETKPTETVDFWKQMAREQEKRAKENAEARKELDAIRESQKTEAEKTADRIKQLEEDAASARREALRFKVASQHGIDSETAELLLTGPDEESMTKQAQAIKQESDARKKTGNFVPTEGTSTRPAENEDRAFARNLFGE